MKQFNFKKHELLRKCGCGTEYTHANLPKTIGDMEYLALFNCIHCKSTFSVRKDVLEVSKWQYFKDTLDNVFTHLMLVFIASVWLSVFILTVVHLVHSFSNNGF